MTRRAPVLVVGGTRGTGRLIVELLAGCGADVRVLARDPVRASTQLGPNVEVAAGDITKPETLGPAVDGVSDLIFTAGVRSLRPARESQVRATEYDGVLHTLHAARAAAFGGRFLYMTASGATIRSLATVALNLYKGNTLHWRSRAEAEIRASGVDYTIIRAGMLVNGPPSQRAVVVTQKPLRLSLRHRIARADVAEAFVAAMRHAGASRATFEVVWGKGPRRWTWSALFDSLRGDTSLAS